MPGDISKHTKYSVDLPYPEVKVEQKNIYYANILLQDYAGEVSEFTAVSLYIYQHFVSDERYKDYAKVIGDISIAEMKHLELLGETIKLLGVKPIFTSSVCPCGQMWTANYVNFDTCIKEMLLEDIRAETKAIESYEKHLCLINDKYIKKLLERIILDEKLHLKIFKELYKNMITNVN
jgi:Mn-containing catalase